MPQEMSYFTKDEVKEMEQSAAQTTEQEKNNNAARRQRKTDENRNRNNKNYTTLLWIVIALVAVLFVLAMIISVWNDKTTQAASVPTNASQAVSVDSAASEVQEVQQTELVGPQVSKDDWFMVLASPGNPLPEGFDPETELVDSAGYYLDSRAVEDFFAMEQAATDAGLQLKVISGFRSANRQQSLYEAQVQQFLNDGLSQQEAEAQAQRIEQKQYESDHNTGLAVDIVPTYKQTKDAAVITQLPEYQWLVEHAAEYGFILRYPQDKEEVTGVEFKPWHWRYVGKEMAAFLTENNLTLDEYWQTYFS